MCTHFLSASEAQRRKYLNKQVFSALGESLYAV